MRDLSFLQLRRLLGGLGLPTAGLRAELEQRVRRARASGVLARFAEQEKRAALTPSGSLPPHCGELFLSLGGRAQTIDLMVCGMGLCSSFTPSWLLGGGVRVSVALLFGRACTHTTPRRSRLSGRL